MDINLVKNITFLEAIHRRMGTSRQQIETDWPGLRKRINANFRAREVSALASSKRKEEAAKKSNDELKSFLASNLFDDEERENPSPAASNPSESDSDSSQSQQEF